MDKQFWHSIDDNTFRIPSEEKALSLFRRAASALNYLNMQSCVAVVTDEVLKCIGQYCTNLEHCNIRFCFQVA